MRFSRCGVALALLAAPLAGCGDDDTSSPRPASAGSPAVVKVQVPPGTATGFVGARIDVTDLRCTRDGATWHVEGKVRNPTQRPADYRIYTSFLTEDSDTRGVLQTDVRAVGAGSARAWRGDLAVPDVDLRCVLRVERTTAVS